MALTTVVQLSLLQCRQWVVTSSRPVDDVVAAVMVRRLVLSARALQ